MKKSYSNGKVNSGKTSPLSPKTPKKIIPAKKVLTPKKKRLLIFTCVLLLIILCIGMYLQYVSPYREAKKIIETAKELVQYIPNQHGERDRIDEALTRMEIITPNKDGSFDPDHKKSFFLLITPEDQLGGSDEARTVLMEFHVYSFESRGQIVVMMNDRAPIISKDYYAKASALIHELVHGLQYGEHARKKEKMDAAMHFADERAAWNSQYFLYQKVCPEIFRGLNCICATQTILGETEEQQKILEGDDRDRLVRSIVLYAMCGDAFLHTMYKEKKEQNIFQIPR